MFDIRRLAHFRKPALQTAPAGVAAGAAVAVEPVKLIAITEENADSNSLRQIASDFCWRISVAATSAVAIRMLYEQPTPLVICDRELGAQLRRFTQVCIDLENGSDGQHV